MKILQRLFFHASNFTILYPLQSEKWGGKFLLGESNCCQKFPSFIKSQALAVATPKFNFFCLFKIVGQQFASITPNQIIDRPIDTSKPVVCCLFSDYIPIIFP